MQTDQDEQPGQEDGQKEEEEKVPRENEEMEVKCIFSTALLSFCVKPVVTRLFSCLQYMFLFPLFFYANCFQLLKHFTVFSSKRAVSVCCV